MIFKDRVDAGRQLAQALLRYKGQDVVVYALPRGGVVLGAEIARALEAPLDLIVVRKVGHPSSPEYAIAAVAEDGHTVVNQAEVSAIAKDVFEESVRLEQDEARRRRLLYTRGRAAVPATGKTAIIVDDGLATGLTMFAAVQEMQHWRPARLIVAVPVAPPQTIGALRRIVDEVVTLYAPDQFGAIGRFYWDFSQVTDDEVIELMKAAGTLAPSSHERGDR
jgi:predicted phosphoribosyltransferase